MSESRDPADELDQTLRRGLLDQRCVLLGEPLEERNTNRIVTAILLLAAQDPEADIRLLINSPGGSVPGMLAIRDCMRAVPNDVCTVNVGMAYSAGQFLLSAGTPGKRLTLAHSKVLLHQGSAGFAGSAMDIAIQADDLRHTREVVLGLIAADTGQPVETVEQDSRRDRWFTAEQALDYGFVDAVVDEAHQIVPARRQPLGLRGEA